MPDTTNPAAPTTAEARIKGVMRLVQEYASAKEHVNLASSRQASVEQEAKYRDYVLTELERSLRFLAAPPEPQQPATTEAPIDILKGLSDAEVRTLASTETPKPMAGTWVLTAPDGQTWTGDSPIKCAQAEMHSRVPPQVALARIRRSLLDEETDPDGPGIPVAFSGFARVINAPGPENTTPTTKE